jgi:hypothetical protein
MRRETRAALEAALAFHTGERPADVQAWSESLARTLGRGRRVSRILVGVALLMIVFAGLAVIQWRVLHSTQEPVRIVEKVGAFDPLKEGFEVREQITRSGVTEDATHTGYDGWRLETANRGLYIHPFTDSQKRRAMERGWKLTAVMKAEEGVVYAAAEFGGAESGFPIQVFEDGEQEIVRLPTQVVHELRGLDLVQRPAGGYHRYELIYDPVLKSADLYIDGEVRLTGYRGWNENVFRLDPGLLFGAATYKSERGAGSFRSVRFEINP